MALTQQVWTSLSFLSGEFIAAGTRGSCVLVNRMLSQYNNGRKLNRLFSLGQFYFLSSNTDPSDKFTLKMASGSRFYSEDKFLGPSCQTSNDGFIKITKENKLKRSCLETFHEEWWEFPELFEFLSFRFMVELPGLTWSWVKWLISKMFLGQNCFKVNQCCFLIQRQLTR